MPKPASPLPFQAAKAYFLAEKEKEMLIRKGSVSPITLSQYGYHLDHLLNFLVDERLAGEKKSKKGSTTAPAVQDRREILRAAWLLEDVKTEDLERYLIWHTKKGGSQSTLSTELYSYRSFWKLLKAKGKVSEDAAAPIKRKTQKYQEAPHLKEKHIQKFQEYLTGMDETDPLSFRNKVLFSVICKFGCRITEALTLTRKNLSLKSEEVVCSILGKGNKKRVLPLPLYDEGIDAKGKYLPQPIPGHIEFADLLQRFIQSSTGLPWFLSQGSRASSSNTRTTSKPAAAAESPFLFQSSRFQRLSDDMARVEFQRIMTEVGLDGYGYSPHSLRHTAATNWLNSQVDLKTVSELLGHANVLTTGTIYSHTEAKKLRRGLAKSL